MINKAYQCFFKGRLKSFLNPIRIARKIHSFEDLMYTMKVAMAFAKPIMGFFSVKRANIIMLFDSKYEKNERR